MLFVDKGWVLSYLGRNVIRSVGDVLAIYPDVKSLLESYTDSKPYIGGFLVDDKVSLSIKRAIAVVEVFNNNPKVNLDNIDIVGYGDLSPTSNNTEEGKAKNRSIVFILTPNPEGFK